jgi:hypothetical protein
VVLAALQGRSKSVIEAALPLEYIPERELARQLLGPEHSVKSTKNEPSNPMKTGTNAINIEILNVIRFQYNFSFIVEVIGVPLSEDFTFSASIWQNGLAFHKGMADSIDSSIETVCFIVVSVPVDLIS